MADLVCPRCLVSAGQAERCSRCGSALVSRNQPAAIQVATAVPAGSPAGGALTHVSPAEPPPAPGSGYRVSGLEPSAAYPGMPTPTMSAAAVPAPWGTGPPFGHPGMPPSAASGYAQVYPTPATPGFGPGMAAAAYGQMRVPIAAAAEPTADMVAGSLAGLLAAGVGALAWAVTGSITLHSYSLLAIAVGALVGCAVAWAAQGRGPQLGLVAAVLALLGCAAGDFVARVWVEANQLNETFGVRLGLAVHNPAAYLAPTGVILVFYGIAAYEAFRFAQGPRLRRRC